MVTNALSDGEQAAFAAIVQGDVKKGSALVIRYEGPRGSPGMPEAPSLPLFSLLRTTSKAPHQ